MPFSQRRPRWRAKELRSRLYGVKAGKNKNTMKQYLTDDRDYAAFVIYAARELSLDASLRNAAPFSGEEHRRSIAALRELNKKMLFKETRHARF
jgi:hypothetical protein